jgi:hypothetical protein
MNEISLRERDAAPVTWGELKVELLAVVQAVAAMAIEQPERLPALLAQLGHSHEASVFGQLLTHHFGPPRAPG